MNRDNNRDTETTCLRKRNRDNSRETETTVSAEGTADNNRETEKYGRMNRDNINKDEEQRWQLSWEKEQRQQNECYLHTFTCSVLTQSYILYLYFQFQGRPETSG